MFYSYKNLPVTIAGNQIVCSNLSLNVSNDISPVYRLGDRSTNDYSPGNASIGSFDFTYYLTGADPIKRFITDDTVFINANIGGWTFNSGRLKSYAVNGNPNQPVEVKSSITFFDPLQGSLGAQTPVVCNFPSLNFADVTIDSLNGYTSDPISNLVSFGFDYSANIQPVYHIDENIGITNVIPRRVIINQKTINCQITSDNIQPQLSIFGERAGIKINFTHPSLPDLTESLMCSGFLTQKNYKTSVGDRLTTELSVIQHHTNTAPFIDSFSPTTANVGDVVTVYGRNLSSVIDVFVYNENPLYKAANINAVDDQTLTFSVTNDCRTGPIILRSLWGTSQTDTQLTVNYGSLNIRSTNVSASLPGELIYIEGSNIQNITSVTFGGTIASYFSHLGTTGLLVQVPPNAVSGPVVIGSRQTLQTGTTTFDFIVPPSISGFVPSSGIYGDTITISGKNFTGISGVLFNTVSAPFTLINGVKITATVPSGWTRGAITISGASGYTTISSGIFEPIVKIVGVSPLSGYPLTAVRITGSNLDTGTMYPFPSGGWQVGFNGFLTGFTRVSNTLLTGTVPSGTTNGPIAIYRKDGTTFPTNFIWSRIYNPTAYFCTPTGVYSGTTLNMSVSGENLYSINAVSFTGTSPNNAGTTITVGNSYFTSDRFGTHTTLTGFPLLGRSTGSYDLVMANSAGSTTLTGALTIFGQVNRAREFYVRAYSSTTGITGSPYPFIYHPQYAIDGNTSNSGIFALTQSESGAWWECRLLRAYPISRIVIYPYATGSTALLTNFSGIVYSGDHSGIAWSTLVATPTLPSHTFTLPANTSGKYFRIAKASSGFVGVGEVEIY